MTSQPLRLTEPGELPAPRTDADSAAVLAQAVDTPPPCSPLTGSATAPSGCTPSPALSPRHTR